MTRRATLILIVLTVSLFNAQLPAQQPPPQAVQQPLAAGKGTSAQLPIICQKVFGGKKLEVELQLGGTPVTEAVPQQYTVKVPLRNADGTVTFRTETRTRMVQVTKVVGSVKKRVSATDYFDFVDLNGAPLADAKVLERIPADGKHVVLLQGTEVPAPWKDVLKEDTVLMRRKATPPAPPQP